MSSQQSTNEEELRAYRNSVFAAQQAAAGGLPTLQGVAVQDATQTARRDLGFELPVAVVPLPSRGLVYPDQPLQGSETLDIKAMTAKEEDILMNRTLARKGTIIKELIKSCLMDKTIDVGSLISGDQHALMVAIRISGYGSAYTSKVTCPSCELQQDHTVDLENLPVKELDLDKVKQVAPFQNAFEFTLPVTKKVVVFKFLTGAEEERILQDMEARKKKGFTQESPVTTKLLNSILSIDGSSDRSFVNKFCQHMPAMDSSALRRVMDEAEPGLDMTADFCCGGCGHQEVMSVTLGPSFFWPNAK